MSKEIQEFEESNPVTTGAGLNTPLGKILVVDDEPQLRSLLVESLQRHGYEVTGCGSGRNALAKLRERDFDLLLTELVMPEMDGIALLRTALEIDPHLVGIIVTGQGTIQTAVDSMQLGAFDYVLKPFRMQNLLPVLSRAVNTRRLRLENLQLQDELKKSEERCRDLMEKAHDLIDEHDRGIVDATGNPIERGRDPGQGLISAAREDLNVITITAGELEQLSAKTAEILKEAELTYERITKDQEETERLKMETREMLAPFRAA